MNEDKENEDACPLRSIDELLLNLGDVSQEQREAIMEQVFKILYRR